MIQIKKYWIFGICKYEAIGGIHDYLFSADSLELAEKSVKYYMDNESKYLDIFWIVDMETMKTVKYFERLS